MCMHAKWGKKKVKLIIKPNWGKCHYKPKWSRSWDFPNPTMFSLCNFKFLENTVCRMPPDLFPWIILRKDSLLFLFMLWKLTHCLGSCTVRFPAIIHSHFPQMYSPLHIIVPKNVDVSVLLRFFLSLFFMCKHCVIVLQQIKPSWSAKMV